MKKNKQVLLSYKAKNYNKGNTPLTNHFPLINHYNSFTSFKTDYKNQTKPTNELTYTKNDKQKFKQLSFSKNITHNTEDKHHLYHIFKKPKEKIKNKFIWPKLTHPKLPFSKREKISEEERKKRIREQRPNRIYHDFHMIKWLRSKFSDSLIEKSVFSMLPDNGKPVVPDDETEEEKKHRLLMEYVDTLYKKVPEREKYVNINPKYFFDEKTFKKILKFKEIFLEFDEDQSRKMEIDEMVEMFNQNHINANLEDLRNLFFKDKRVKKEDIMKLYLDFYQFMTFALTKDQDFRDFMREIKARREKKKKVIRIGDQSKNEEDDESYLPMNFNLMFDFFLMKGKERASIDEIEKSIIEMDKIINNNKSNGNDEGENSVEEKNKSGSDRKNNTSLFKNTGTSNENNEDIQRVYIDYEEQLKKLNFIHLIDNFITLFHLSESSTRTLSDSFIELAENHQQNSNIKNLKKKEDINIKTSMFTEKDIINKESPNKIHNKNVSPSTGLKDNALEKLVKHDINKKIIKNLNMKNYNKYHDVNLALTETKKEVNSFIKAQKSKDKIIKKLKNNNYLNINDISIININSNSKIHNSFNFSNKKDKAIKIKPLYKFDNNKNYISKNYYNSVKINQNYISNNLNNQNNQNDHKSELNSINSYMSKEKPKNKISSKLDYVPPELLKEKKKRYFKFFI